MFAAGWAGISMVYFIQMGEGFWLLFLFSMGNR